MNSQETIYNLIAKKLSGESSEEENQQVESWISEHAENKKEFEQMKKIDELNTPEEYVPNVEGALKNVHTKLPPQLKSTKVLPSSYIKYIAAILMLGAFIGLVVFPLFQAEKLIVVSNTNENSMPMKVRLSDGSQVWLSYGSTISYPKKYKGNERRVQFEGEAYFDVARNEHKVFVIETEDTETSVLGTEFVLRANPRDKEVSITVTEGKVALRSLFDKAESGLILVEGEKGVYHKELKEFQQEEVETTNASALKTGKLKFYNVPASEIIEAINSHYNKQLEIITPGLDTVTLKQNYINLDFYQAMEVLELSLGVEIVEEEGIYKIKEKS